MSENPDRKYYVNKTLSDAVFIAKEFEYGETIYETSINSPKKYDTQYGKPKKSGQKLNKKNFFGFSDQKH